MCIEHLSGCTLGFHTSDREGKGSRTGQNIRLVMVQSEPRPCATLWRALRLGGLSELFPSTVRKLGIFILSQAVSVYRQNLRRHPDLRQNGWGEHFLGRAASWGLGPSVLKSSDGRMQADIVFHVPLQA